MSKQQTTKPESSVVFLVHYDSKCGSQFSVHRTFDSAKYYLEEWAAEQWGDEWEQVNDLVWTDGGDEYMSISEEDLKP